MKSTSDKGLAVFEKIHKAIQDSGSAGHTNDELELIFAGLGRSTVSCRTRDLVKRGFVKDSGKRRPTRTGRLANVWIAADPSEEVPMEKKRVKVNGESPWDEGNDRIDDVLIDRECERVGWAVYTGTEGDDPTFIAFFVNKDMAQNYIDACMVDSDKDWWLCDPQITPACVENGRILVANHYDDDVGRVALQKALDYADRLVKSVS